MRKLTVVLTIFGSLFFVPITASAQSGNFRLLLHGTNQIDNSRFGVSGWVISPNITNAPDKWLAVVGPRYDGDGWWVEMMGGAFIQQGESTPLFDFRANLKKVGPFTAWTNIEWIDFFGEDKIYAYLEVNHALPGNIGFIGVETENVFREGDNTISMGPRLVIPFKTMALAMVYQFHRRANNQIWFRAIINL